MLVINGSPRDLGPIFGQAPEKLTQVLAINSSGSRVKQGETTPANLMKCKSGHFIQCMLDSLDLVDIKVLWSIPFRQQACCNVMSCSP